MTRPSTATEATDPRWKRLYRRLRAPLALLAFWSAIALPAAYLPLLALGIETIAHTTVLAGLLGLNAIALLVGHSYRPDR